MLGQQIMSFVSHFSPDCFHKKKIINKINIMILGSVSIVCKWSIHLV